MEARQSLADDHTNQQGAEMDSGVDWSVSERVRINPKKIRTSTAEH